MAPTGTTSALTAAITGSLANAIVSSSPTTSSTTSATTTPSPPSATASTTSNAQAAKEKKIVYWVLFNPISILIYCAILYWTFKLCKYCLVVSLRKDRMARHNRIQNQSQNPQDLQQEQEQRQYRQWNAWEPAEPVDSPLARRDADPDKAVALESILADQPDSKTLELALADAQDADTGDDNTLNGSEVVESTLSKSVGGTKEDPKM
ncbi:hypothetical protein SBRCBS47491_007754 [Sporothrix bragantina]|uniref:Uncharacterized protein n=1 Tax=Sporothrix bragantina TaxID=671064 RepID=A0ABP0CH25_9PEZI